MICHGCGGVVGQDCFNPQECLAIARDKADRYDATQEAFRSIEHEVEMLQAENEKLRESLKLLIGFAATAQASNTEDWMNLLASRLNDHLRDVGDETILVARWALGEGWIEIVANPVEASR